MNSTPVDRVEERKRRRGRKTRGRQGGRRVSRWLGTCRTLGEPLTCLFTPLIALFRLLLPLLLPSFTLTHTKARPICNLSFFQYCCSHTAIMHKHPQMYTCALTDNMWPEVQLNETQWSSHYGTVHLSSFMSFSTSASPSLHPSFYPPPCLLTFFLVYRRNACLLPWHKPN